MIQTKHRDNLRKIHQVNLTVFTIFCLLAAIFTATTAGAQELSTYENHNGILKKLSGDGPDLIVFENNIAKKPSIWEQTKVHTDKAWQATKVFSENAWNETEAFLETDDNLAWTYITGGGFGLIAGGIGATTTTSILGILTISTIPAWAPILACTGTAIATVGATALVLENIDE